MAVPMSICPCPGLFDSLELEKLCATFDTYAPSHVDEKRGVYHKRTWESVRQLVGALGLGDHMEEDRRNAIFDQLDMDADGLVCLHGLGSCASHHVHYQCLASCAARMCVTARDVAG